MAKLSDFRPLTKEEALAARERYLARYPEVVAFWEATAAAAAATAPTHENAVTAFLEWLEANPEWDSYVVIDSLSALQQANPVGEIEVSEEQKAHPAPDGVPITDSVMRENGVKTNDN